MNQNQHLVLTLLIVIAVFAIVIRLRSTGFWTALTTKKDIKPIDIPISTPLGTTKITLFGKSS